MLPNIHLTAFAILCMVVGLLYACPTIKSLFASDYTVGRVLGSGAHGSARLGQLVATGETVVLKTFKPRFNSNGEKEAQILSCLSHPLIPRLIGVHYDDANGHTLVESLVPGSSLAWHILGQEGTAIKPDDEGVPLTAENAAQCLADILSALRHMHQRGIAHFDLNSSNILITADQNHAHLIDFSAAKMGVMNEAGEYGDEFKVFAGKDVVMAARNFYFMMNGRSPPKGLSYPQLAETFFPQDGQYPRDLFLQLSRNAEFYQAFVSLYEKNDYLASIQKHPFFMTVDAPFVEWTEAGTDRKHPSIPGEAPSDGIDTVLRIYAPTHSQQAVDDEEKISILGTPKLYGFFRDPDDGITYTRLAYKTQR